VTIRTFYYRVFSVTGEDPHPHPPPQLATLGFSACSFSSFVQPCRILIASSVFMTVITTSFFIYSLWKSFIEHKEELSMFLLIARPLFTLSCLAYIDHELNGEKAFSGEALRDHAPKFTIPWYGVNNFEVYHYVFPEPFHESVSDLKKHAISITFL